MYSQRFALCLALFAVPADATEVHGQECRRLSDRMGLRNIQASVNDLPIGFDVDGDGKKDQVVLSCGAGVGQLCSFTVAFANHRVMRSGDLGPARFVTDGKHLFISETIDGAINPYTQQSSVTIWRIDSEKVDRVCRQPHEAADPFAQSIVIESER